MVYKSGTMDAGYLQKLKTASLYLSMQKGLRTAAWSSLGWGAFTLLIGFLVQPTSLLDYLWIALGLVLVAEGIWLLRSPVPKALLAEAGVLLLLGLWNTVGMYFEYQAGAKPIAGGRLIFIGILQLINAYTTYRSYPVYRTAYDTRDTLAVAELQQMTDPIWKAKTAEATDMIEFTVDNDKCKLKFFPDCAAMVSHKGRTFSVFGRDELAMDRVGETMLGKKAKIQAQLGPASKKFDLKPEYFDRYQLWKSGTTGATTVSVAGK